VKGRRSIVTAISVAAVVVMASPAGARPPTAGCPPAFRGPFTAAQVVEMWPPPPEVTDPEGAILSYDKNGDRSVCVLPLPGGPINVIDNTASVP
jgi:hypothetical protein